MDERWEAVRDRIRDELEILGLPEVFVVGEPKRFGPAPRTAWWQIWRSRKPQILPGIYAQFLRIDSETIICEFSGSTIIGADYPMSAEIHEQLHELGWLIPEDPHYWDSSMRKGKGGGNYRMHPHPDQVPTVARIVTDSLTLLVPDPAVLQYERFQ